MRIVSLCPSLTELVVELGAADSLVGRTRFCIHPADVVARIERVGGTKNPNIARIVALRPELVLMNEEENRREDADALRVAGIAVHSSLPRTIPETAAMVRSIAAAIGREAAGAAIAGDIESRAERAAGEASRRAPTSFAYLIWWSPLMSVNGDTFVDAMLSLAGGRNVFATSGERYPVVTAEQLRAAAPDRVFLSSEPFPFKEVHAAELSARTGLDSDRFVFVDGELLSWHGSRTPRGIDYAASLMAGARPVA